MSADILWRCGDKPVHIITPEYPKHKSDTYNCNNGSELRLIKNTDPCEFENYCKALSNAGFTFITENSYSGNRFLTFKRDEELLQANCFADGEEVRIITEPDFAPLPDTKFENKHIPLTLHQLSLDQTNIDCGMSYILTLCDGSLFIIDGGYFTPGEETRLYDYLTKLCGTDINIAGWFFSHAHQDHIGCFMDFIKKYSGTVKIEALYYNFPSLALEESSCWSQSDNQTIAEFYEAVAKYLPGIPNIKLHTGQKFSVRNLDFEVLLTHEDLYPPKITNFNDSSTVLMMEGGGQKTLWLGDIGDDASAALIRNAETRLLCDIVQVAHHGFNGAWKEVYCLADPETVLWPTADYRFNENINREANHFLLYRLPDADHFISGYGNTVLPLPYTPGSVRDNSDKIPDEI